jgi:hypothetical protein
MNANLMWNSPNSGIHPTDTDSSRSRLTRAGPVLSQNFSQKSLTAIELLFLLQPDSSQAFRYLEHYCVNLN